MTESTKEAAARLRTELKRHGWNSRDVTIRTEYFSLGSSIDVTIRSARVNAPELEQIVRSAERIDRCEITGEILGGGNRYLDIRYTPAVQTILARRHQDALESAIDKLEADGNANALYLIEGTNPQVFVGWDQQHNSGRILLWTDRAERGYNLSRPGDPHRAACLEGIAFHLAVLLEKKRAELKAEGSNVLP